MNDNEGREQPSSSQAGGDQINVIKDLFGHPYFQLALEKEVRAHTEARLKALGAVATVILAIAGYGSWNLVDEARKKLDAQTQALKEEQQRLETMQRNLQDKTDRLTEKAVEFESRSNEAANRSQDLLNKMGREAASVNAEKPIIDRAKEDAESAMREAQNAISSAQTELSNAKVASKEAQEAQNAAEKARKGAEAATENAVKSAGQLAPLLGPQVELLKANETAEVLVRGKKAPCVDLENSLAWPENEPQPIIFHPPKPYHVRFRVAHIHFHPVNLQLEVLDSCQADATGDSYSYVLPKEKTEEDHPIVSTPFAFRMAFVYDPKLAFDFVVLKITVKDPLLKCPDFKSCKEYADRRRQPAVPMSADLALPSSYIPVVNDTPSYWKKTFGSGAFGKVAFLASYDQARDSPKEWGQGTAGYSRRFASRFGRRVIDRTIALGVATVHGEDQRYIPADNKRTWARVQHAVVYTFLTRRSEGSDTLALSRIAGAYGSSLIATSWYPPSQRSLGNALHLGTESMGFKVAGNILREFAPDIQRAFDRHFVRSLH